MDNVLETIQNPVAFSFFLNENMKTSTYKIGWTAEMDVEYEASKSFSTITATYAAAILGTVIDKNGNRPKHGMPSVGDITGKITRMGDEWQMDNDRLERYFLMENRFRDSAKNLSKEQQLVQYKALVKYLFNPYELAAIAPHRRILAQYWEGLSTGSITLTKTNNEGGLVWSAGLDLEMAKRNMRSTDVVWSKDTLATMNVIDTLKYAEDVADVAGKTVLVHRMSKSTFALVSQCTQLKGLIGMNLGKIQTLSTPAMGIDTVNTYLAAVELAPIEVIKEKGVLPDGTSFPMFTSGRVVSQCAPKVAVLKVSDSLELIDPLPNKTYAQFNDNLVSQWRNEKGRFIAYEMFAFPVFTGREDLFILDVTTKDIA